VASRKGTTIVRALRKELRWTRAEFAAKARVSERTINNLDKGQSVREDTCSAIVDCLNRGLKEQEATLTFPVVELRESDLFEFAETDNRQTIRPLRAPADVTMRRSFVRTFMKQKASQ
jgi:transcriptional regulator with XRE-family HTH domain